MRALVPLLLICLAGCPKKPVTQATLHGEGFTARVEAAPFSMTLIGSDGGVLLQTVGGAQVTLDSHVYETQLVPGWDGYRSRERPWRTLVSGTLEHFDESSATLRLLDDASSVVTVTLQTDGARLKYRQVVDDKRSFNKSALAFTLRDDSHFFGMGQRTASVDHLGQVLYSWPEEGGLGGRRRRGSQRDQPVPERSLDELLPGALLPHHARRLCFDRHHAPQ